MNRFAATFAAFAICWLLSPSDSLAQTNIGLQFVDHLDGTVTLQIVPDPEALPGAMATEMSVEAQFEVEGDLKITGATANTDVFLRANPGDNPYIPGLPVGGDSHGLWLDELELNHLFAAFGTDQITEPGPLNFLTITYEGRGNLSASGIIANRYGLVGAQTTVFVPVEAAALLGAPEPMGLTLLAICSAVGLCVRRR